MRILTVLLLALLGLPMLAGGIYLLRLGGSAMYVLSGVWLLLVAWAVIRRRRWAPTAYALWLLVLLGWSLWEAGWHWWPLATRLGLPALLGLWMALPALRRQLDQPLTATRHTARLLPVLGSAVLLALVAFSAILRPEPFPQGRLPMDIVNAQPAVGVDIPADGQWPAYAGTHHGQRYSPLEQISTANVGNLALAWSFRTGDLRRPDDVTETTYQATPLKIGNTLYLCTPHSLAIALDADSGKERWRFDPGAGMDPARQHQTCRGLSYFTAPADAALAAGDAAMCSERLFLPTADAKLYALDAHTGKPCPGFADNGVLDLMHNMPFKQPGFYYSTSPPLVAAGKVIVAGAVNDNYAVDSPSGVIRAYDALTGKLVWNFDSGNAAQTAPLDPNDPSQVYSVSSPNSWSVASADEALGLAYFPMGNRTPDQLSAYRNADAQRYASSVVALDLATGQARWVQQFVHDDLWDMDTPAQPVLLDLDMPQGRVPALVQPTKQGDVYVLDRRDGTPLLPIGQRPAPQTNDIAGQKVSPQQPYSALSFEPEPLREASMWGASLVDQMLCRIAFRKLRYEGRYTPPSVQGTLVYPGNFGVFNWGSVAVDPQRQVMFGMPTYLAFVSTLVPRQHAQGQPLNAGEQGLNENAGADYAVNMHPFLSPLGVPCQQPPWGTVAAADLRTGNIAWQHRNGTIADLSPLPVPVKMGVPGIGGPLLTASGVAFLAAAVDNNFRAYDLASGKVLWDVRIPAGGQATPMSYLDSQGKQTVVLVAGGHGSIGTTAGDYVLAYHLPD